MKIEKMNENQIKFILNREDLMERDIKLNELSYGSEKTQELFREMMEQAVIECDFHAENNTPLIIEAIPVSAEGVMIIVTKANSGDELDSGLNFLPAKAIAARAQKEREAARKPAAKEKPRTEPNTGLLIYAFPSFDLAAQAAAQVRDSFGKVNMLYKCGGRYYLALYNDMKLTGAELRGADSVLKEFGQKMSSQGISWAYLVEHGELLIGDDALAVLSKLA